MKVTEIACVQGAWTPILPSAKLVLDIGSGTGLLSLMLAQRFPWLRIDCIELDEAAFAQGKENIDTSPFSHHIHPHLGDVRNYQFQTPFDFIICNPPFFENQLQSPSELKNKAWHDSALTLHELLKSIQLNLTRDGEFAILFSFNRKEELEQKAKLMHYYPKQYLYIRHTASHEWKYFVVVFGTKLTNSIIEHLTLKDELEKTNEAMDLFAPFYL